MKFITMLLVVGAYALVTGCATVRPTMDEPTSRMVIAAAKLIHECPQQGYMDTNTAGAGRLLLRNRVGDYNVDPEYMEQLAESVPVEISQRTCTEMAIAIAEQQQRAAINRQNASATPQYQYSTPKRTVCNNIAGQMLCSTY